MLCKRNLPSQYKNHLFGLSGHNAGSFTATAFIVGPGGVSIGNPAAASTRLLASIVAWYACCGQERFELFCRRDGVW